MNKKLKKQGVQKLLGVSYDSIYSAVHNAAKDAGIVIPELNENARSEYVWSFSGDNWKSVVDIADEVFMADLAEEYEFRKKRLITSPEFTKVCSTPKDIFVYPSDDCVYYRDNGERGHQFAIVGWGMKYNI